MIHTVAAAVPGAAHGISVASLLPPAAGDASWRSVLWAVTVATDGAVLVAAALLLTAVHLEPERHVIFKGKRNWKARPIFPNVSQTRDSLIQSQNGGEFNTCALSLRNVKQNFQTSAWHEENTFLTLTRRYKVNHFTRVRSKTTAPWSWHPAAKMARYWE